MFCVKCGTRLADDAKFCFNCGNKVSEMHAPVAEPVLVSEPVPVAETVLVSEPVPVAETVPVSEPVSVVEPAPVVDPVLVVEPISVVHSTPVAEAVSVDETDSIAQSVPTVEPAPVAEADSLAQSEPIYDQRAYTMHGSFQQVQSQVMPQDMYQRTEMPQQAFYNTPVQFKNKSKSFSVPGMIFLVISLVASIIISIGQFMDNETGMGIVNIAYFVATIGLIVFCVSSKRIGTILKGAFLTLVLVLNIIFAGVSAFTEAFNIIGNAKAGIDYYYAIVLLLQYIFLYVYLLVSIVRSFMGKMQVSYFTCLCGYFAMLLTVAAFVIDFVSDTPHIFVFSVIPVDLGLITLIAGDLFASLRNGKNIA